MDLLQQFQGVIGSLILGGLFCFIFLLFNALLSHRFIKVLWILIQPILFLSFTFLYHVFLCEFTYGIYNIFFTLSLIVGIVIYLLVYHPWIKKRLNKISNYIEAKILIFEKKITCIIKKLFLKRKKNKKPKTFTYDNK